MMIYEKKDIQDSFSAIKAIQTNPHEAIEVSEININSVNCNKKTAIILCGNNTRDAQRASFYASCFYGWMDETIDRKNIEVYSIFYPKDQPLLTSFELDPSFNYDALAEALFNQAIFKDGKIQSTEEVIENISNIVFFGHSIGGHVMNELMFGLGKILQDNNFSPEDAKKIYNSIVFIAYSPYTLVAAPINHIYITPIYDSMGSTKLVYDRMLKVGNMTTSNPKLDIQNICKFRSNSYYNFLKLFEIAMKNEDTLYFCDHNSLIATPNLLFNDGTKEDHNFAGIINYKSKHPNKTKAGELTTEFLKQTISYTLSISRDKFSTTELFDKVTAGSYANKKEQTTLKEF